MKVRLLRKIRSRIVSVIFCNKRYATINYYDRNNEFSCYSVFCKRDLLFLIRSMFGDFFVKVIEYKNKKANFRRFKKKLNSSIEYSWEEKK